MGMATPGVMGITTIGMTTGIVPLTVAAPAGMDQAIAATKQEACRRAVT